jgi:hypothetical protein
VILTQFQRFLGGAIVALVAIAAILGYEYYGTLARKAELARQLTTLQTTVDKLNAAAASSQGSDPLLHDPAFPPDPPNLQLAGIVLDSATSSGVTAGSLQSTTLGTDKIGDNTYRTVSMNLTVTGTLPQVLDFFDRVERGGIRTIVFDNMRVEPSNGSWSVQIQLIAYAQPG